MSGIKVIDKADFPAGYDGFKITRAILEHPAHGRLLIENGWRDEGHGSYLVSWKSGSIWKLRPTETLDTFRDEYGTWDRMLLRSDDTLEWSGDAIAAVAEAAGL